MDRGAERHELASDNTAGMCPEAAAALAEVNSGAAVSYGDDRWTIRLRKRVQDLFETDCAVHVVFNGTAANAIALAQLCQSFESILCHRFAHIQTDECGAPEFFSKGAKLLLVDGAAGKIDLAQARRIAAEQPELHAQQPRVISVTQATEAGTVYTLEELRAVSEFARAHKMHLHMDGARFANAIAHLNCAPKEMTWQIGVDVLCLGGTKNGLALGELVIFFDQQLARGCEYRVKQAGQLGSKTRFLAAPWLNLLGNDVWLRNARRANAAARRLGDLLRAQGIEPVLPIEANAVFVRLDRKVAAGLQERGWHFYNFFEPDVYRLMCPWNTNDAIVDQFVADVQAARRS